MLRTTGWVLLCHGTPETFLIMNPILTHRTISLSKANYKTLKYQMPPTLDLNSGSGSQLLSPATYWDNMTHIYLFLTARYLPDLWLKLQLLHQYYILFFRMKFLCAQQLLGQFSQPRSRYNLWSNPHHNLHPILIN